MSNKICGAKRQNKNETCKAPAMENGRCRLHGGKSPSGFESPHFVDGSRSKYLKHMPKSVKNSFTANIEQNKKVSLIENLAVADLRLQELVSLLGDGMIFDYFQSIKSTVEFLRQVVCEPPQLDEDGEEIERQPPEFFFQQLNEIFNAIGYKKRLYEEIEEANEHVRKLAESQAKIETADLERTIKSSEFLPKEFVHGFIVALADVLKLSPEDIKKQQLKLLQEKFDSLPGVVKSEPKQLK